MPARKDQAGIMPGQSQVSFYMVWQEKPSFIKVERGNPRVCKLKVSRSVNEEIFIR